MTTYTPTLKLALPVTGELDGQWGNVVNDNITSMVEQAIAGLATINTWTTNAHILTTANGETSESRCAMLVLTDTGAALSGAATVICPTAPKIYIVKNSTAQTATITTAAGTGIAVANGQTMFVFCDGTNVVQAVTNITDATLTDATLTNATLTGAALDFATLTGTGAVSVTNILDEDDMVSDSATALATQQSIKAYVDTQIGVNNDLPEVLANGNTTGSSDIIVTAGQKITTDTIDETTAESGVTIDSVLLKDDGVNATNLEITNIKANDGTASIVLADGSGVATINAAPILTPLTVSQAVFTDSSKALVSNAITGTGSVVMSDSPTLVTPALGTPSALVGTNITGTAIAFTASNVTTNADLTGDVTSVGNATSFGSSTGSGAVVLATSPTLVTPALGTPASGVVTNLTGTASININGTVGATTPAAGTFTQANFADNAKAIFGAGSDLQIYHTGSHSWVQDAGTGSLYVAGDHLWLTNSDNTKQFLKGDSTGRVDLYYNTSVKLATTSTGIDVTGNAAFTTYTETVFAVSGTTPALSPNNGTIQTWTLSGVSTPTAGTWAAGQSLTLMVDDGTAYTITWSSLPVVWKTDAGVAPTLNTSGATAIQLWKVGSTIYGARVGDA